MRDIEKAMRQMEKGASHHALVFRQHSEAALLSPTGRSDSGRTTHSGKLTPPGTTRSGLTTPTGRVTPLGTASSGLTTPTGRVTPPGRAPATGRTTPPGMESGLTTPTGSVTPYGTTISGRSSPVGDAPAHQMMSHDGHIAASTAAIECETAYHDIAPGSAVAGTAAEEASSDVRREADEEDEGLAPRLISSRSSVKDTVALWEGSHPLSSRQPPSGKRQLLPFRDGQPPSSGDGQQPFSNGHAPISGTRQLPFSKGQAPISSRQPSTSLSTQAQTKNDAGAQSTRLVASQSPYQTRSLSEGVYGKLYSSTSSISQDAISAAWNDDNITAGYQIGSGGTDASGSGRHTAVGTNAAAGSGIGRFGGGIGRGGSKFAVDSKPQDESLLADLLLVKQ